MAFVTGILMTYALLFVSGFPFLFFCGNGLWLKMKKKWVWDKKRKIMLLNAAIYPIILILIFILLVKIFGVDRELGRELQKMEIRHTTNILQGSQPSENNSFLGTLFLRGIYLLGTLIPALIVGLIYSLTSTVLLLESKSDSTIKYAFIISVFISILFIFIGFCLRTPIFNYLHSCLKL